MAGAVRYVSITGGNRSARDLATDHAGLFGFGFAGHVAGCRHIRRLGHCRRSVVMMALMRAGERWREQGRAQQHCRQDVLRQSTLQAHGAKATMGLRRSQGACGVQARLSQVTWKGRMADQLASASSTSLCATTALRPPAWRRRARRRRLRSGPGLCRPGSCRQGSYRQTRHHRGEADADADLAERRVSVGDA